MTSNVSCSWCRQSVLFSFYEPFGWSGGWCVLGLSTRVRRIVGGSIFSNNLHVEICECIFVWWLGYRKGLSLWSQCTVSFLEIRNKKVKSANAVHDAGARLRYGGTRWTAKLSSVHAVTSNIHCLHILIAYSPETILYCASEIIKHDGFEMYFNSNIS